MKRCQHCNIEEPKLRRVIAQNGDVMVAWRCLACNRWARDPNHWIPHDGVRQILRGHGLKEDFGQIPIFKDYRDERCEFCGTEGAEWHHFVPQALADLVEKRGLLKWFDFGAYLCKEHHDQWHELVTWYMPGRGATELGRKARQRWQQKDRKPRKQHEDGKPQTEAPDSPHGTR